jgi:hypothetical protein
MDLAFFRFRSSSCHFVTIMMPKIGKPARNAYGKIARNAEGSIIPTKVIDLSLLNGIEPSSTMSFSRRQKKEFI